MKDTPKILFVLCQNQSTKIWKELSEKMKLKNSTETVEQPEGQPTGRLMWPPSDPKLAAGGGGGKSPETERGWTRAVASRKIYPVILVHTT